MINKRTLILGSLLFICFAAFAQEKAPAKDDQAAHGASEKEMAAWTAYMTPGPMHKMLMEQNGDWREEITMWMAPDAPPQKMEAWASNSMILGDRYQVSLHTGDMGGMPFEGRSTCGYDNIRKVFQSTWIDNMGTGMMYLEGTYDEKTKEMVMRGTTVDPMTGKTEKVREVFKVMDDGSHKMEMFMTKNGKEFKNMEIKLNKKK